MRHNVLYVITGLHVGGAEKVLLNLTKHLDRERYEPVVCTFVGGELIPEFERLGIRVHHIGMRHRWDVRLLWRFWHVLRTERPVIVHSHLFHADVLSRLLGRLAGIPIIVNTFHMLEVFRHNRFFRQLDRASLIWSDAQLAVSEEVKRSLARLERLDETRIHVIPNGVESPQTFDPATRLHKRQELGVSEHAPLIGIVSRLEEPRKGHRVLFEALSELVHRFPLLHCVVVGDGPARKRLEAYARELKLEHHISFVGESSDVFQWLRALDLFVLPSFLEGSPMVVLEAMAAGCAIVTTPVGGIPEAITHEQTGLLVPPGDSRSLTEAIERLLQDRPLARRLGAMARQVYQECFDIGHTTRQTMDWYDGLINQRLNRRLKVLLVSTTFDRGGVTAYLDNLIGQLPADRFEVSLACGMEDFQADHVARLGIQHYPVCLTKPIRPLDDIRALWQLVGLIRRERVDVVHTHMSKSDLIAGLAARLCGLPVLCVSTAHGPLRLRSAPLIVQRFFDGLERWVYRGVAHRVISVAVSTTEELLRKRKVVRRQVVTIPNGIRPHTQATAERRGEIRSRLGVKPEQPLILMVSRLTEPKAPDVLIESMPRVLQRWPQAVCLIAGEGPNRADLHALISRLGMEGVVRLLGDRDDVRDLLDACDVFALSSYSEGLSMSVLEAMAAGCPIVASDVGGMDELITHDRTGVLVAAGDAEALANALNTLIQNPALRQSLGTAALEQVDQRFSVSRQVQETAEVYVQDWLRVSAAAARWAVRPGPFERLRRFIHEEGWRSTAMVLAKKVMRPFGHRADIWFLERQIQDPIVRIESRVACNIRLATLSDIDGLVAVSFENREAVIAALSSPVDRCFIAEQRGRVLAFQWMRLGESDLHIVPMEQAIHLRKYEAYLYNCRAMRDFRGQSIIPAIEVELFRWLKQNGFTRLYTDIRNDNLASLKTFEKLGCERMEHVRIQRYGPWRRLHCERPRYRLSEPCRVLVLHSGVHQRLDWVETCRLDERLFRFSTVSLPSAAGMRQTLGDVVRLVQRISQERVEIIHCDGWRTLVLGVLLRALSGGHARLTVTIGENVSGACARTARRRDVWLRLLAKQAQVFFFHSSLEQADGLQQGWLKPDQSFLVQEDLPLSSTQEDGQTDTTSARKQLGMNANAPVIGTIMPLVHEFNPWRFLAFCQRVGALLPACHFVMGGDGPLFFVLRKRAEELGLASRIRFVRRDFDRRALLHAMDIFIDPARDAETSLVRLEAMASAKAVMELDEEPAIMELIQHTERCVALGSAARQQVVETLTERYQASQYAIGWHRALHARLARVSTSHWTEIHGRPVAF